MKNNETDKNLLSIIISEHITTISNDNIIYTVTDDFGNVIKDEYYKNGMYIDANFDVSYDNGRCLTGLWELLKYKKLADRLGVKLDKYAEESIKYARESFDWYLHKLGEANAEAKVNGKEWGTMPYYLEWKDEDSYKDGYQQEMEYLQELQKEGV